LRDRTSFIRTLREQHRYDDRLAFRPWFFTILRRSLHGSWRH
jgi:DNA-directed RNA polymerase specialized sigma24 family protein